MHLPSVGIILAVFALQSAHAQKAVQQCSQGSIALSNLRLIAGDVLVSKDDPKWTTIPPGGGWTLPTWTPHDLAIAALPVHQDHEDRPRRQVTEFDNDRCCPATVTQEPNTEYYYMHGQKWYAMYSYEHRIMQMKSTVECESRKFQCCIRCWFKERCCEKRCGQATSLVSVLVTSFNPNPAEGAGLPLCIPMSQIRFKKVPMGTHCKCLSM